MKINKFLAYSGVASRRKCNELVLQNKIKVNGKICNQPTYEVGDTDVVKYENKIIKLLLNNIYFKLYKPKGYLTTITDDRNRKTVADLLRGIHTRVYPVGRLDYDSEGLLLVTNDGEIAEIFERPKNEIEKVYIVKIEGTISDQQIERLQKGVNIGDNIVTKECKIEILDNDEKSTRLQFTIKEGKNRQIRKMLQNQGKAVILLKRTQIGEIKLGGLSRGEYRALNKQEMSYIKKIKAKYAG